jgi:hypothetical protein
MGGSGSGHWQWYRPKRTVENCFKLSINDLMRDIPADVRAAQADYSGSIRVGTFYRVEYDLMWIAGAPRLELSYLAVYERGREWRNLTVHLQTTPCHIGNERYWFTCPKCNKRVGCLYLPAHESHFYCRSCHDLTYKSAQQAHDDDRGYYGLILRLNRSSARLKMLTGQLKGLHGGSKKSRRVWAKIDAQLAVNEHDRRAFIYASEAHYQRVMTQIERYNKRAAKILGE